MHDAKVCKCKKELIDLNWQIKIRTRNNDTESVVMIGMVAFQFFIQL